jgi:hypothetical protein
MSPEQRVPVFQRCQGSSLLTRRKVPGWALDLGVRGTLDRCSGYWVIYAPGPFTDSRAALSYCDEHGRTTANTCIGLYLSTSSADYDRA